MKAAFVAAALSLALLGPASAVRNGDEDYEAEDSVGYFYVFADKAINIVDPATMEVVKNITVDQSGAPLTNNGSVGNPVNQTRTWNDCVYLQNETAGFVFINEGDIYEYGNGTLYSYVTVVDTTLQEVVARVEMGALPVHGYAVTQTKEFWSHSDYDGSFWTISVDDVSQLNTSDIPDTYETPGHGKLCLDEDLYPLAYATNVNEQYINLINLETQTRLKAFGYASQLPDPSLCVGTHSIGYSNISKHIYVECVDGTGILEWDTVAERLVKFMANETGYISVYPASDKIIVIDYDMPTVNVLRPQSNGEPAEAQYTIEVLGNPDLNPVYWSSDPSGGPFDNPQAAVDYLAFFSLTANVNIYNLKAAAAAGGDAQDPFYFAAPIDCEYKDYSSSENNGTSDDGLVLATASNGTVLTPQCGACAPGVASQNPADYNASLSGLRFANLTAVEAAAKQGQDATAPLISAGAVAQVVNEDTGANECSYGSPNRASLAGGPYIAVVADFPQSSLYIVYPANQTVKGYVPTAGNPAKIAWVPIQNNEVSASSAGK